MLFAAEYDKPRTDQLPSLDVIQKLSHALHGTLIILILYYLDTRATTTSRMPSWMFLQGLVFNENGLRLRNHHPTFDERWSLVSHSSVVVYSKANPPDWSQVVARLYRMQSHMNFVFERLKEWDGYGQTVEHLLREKLI